MLTRTQLNTINGIVADIDKVDEKIRILESDLHGITLHGKYHDELKPLVKPLLLDHYNEEKRKLLNDLKHYGFVNSR